MFVRLKSFITYFYIHSERILDHTYRRITGLPTMRRSEITPYLYLGGQYYKKGIQTLKQIGITGIVNMREGNIKQHQGMEQFQNLHLPTKDLHAPSITQLQKGIAFIQGQIEQGGKVYVHCRWGEGRGPTMVIAYLMSTGMILEDALALVKDVRPFINPTKPQLERLAELEKILIK